MLPRLPTSPCCPPPSSHPHPTCAISSGAPIVFFRSTSDVVSERAVAVNSGLAFTVLRTELRSVCSAEAGSEMPVGGSAALQARRPGFGAVDQAQAAEAEAELLPVVALRPRPAEVEEGPRVAAIAEAVVVSRPWLAMTCWPWVKVLKALTPVCTSRRMSKAL